MIGYPSDVLISMITYGRKILEGYPLFTGITTMKDKRIEEIWNEIEDTEPDISTERLMAMTVERINMETGKEFNCGDVAEALYRLHIKKKDK
jgi:hypothetical protein